MAWWCLTISGCCACHLIRLNLIRSKTSGNFFDTMTSLTGSSQPTRPSSMPAARRGTSLSPYPSGSDPLPHANTLKRSAHESLGISWPSYRDGASDDDPQESPCPGLTSVDCEYQSS